MELHRRICDFSGELDRNYGRKFFFRLIGVIDLKREEEKEEEARRPLDAVEQC